MGLSKEVAQGQFELRALAVAERLFEGTGNRRGMGRAHFALALFALAGRAQGREPGCGIGARCRMMGNRWHGSAPGTLSGHPPTRGFENGEAGGGLCGNGECGKRHVLAIGIGPESRIIGEPFA